MMLVSNPANGHFVNLNLAPFNLLSFARIVRMGGKLQRCNPIGPYDFDKY